MDYYYQHNKTVLVTKENLKYVREYKTELLNCLHKLFTDLNIRYVIAHGNLIEYSRNSLIYHDDDIDVRFSFDDIDKWYIFCIRNTNICHKYNLLFNIRYSDFKAQLENGVNASLISFKNINNIKTFSNIYVSIDIVPSKVVNKITWPNYDIDYNNLKKINYLGVETYAPLDDDSDRLLKKEYGDWKIPNKNITYDDLLDK